MFLHTYHPQPILINLGLLKIHWYGFLIVCGLVIGFLVVLKLIKKYGLDSYKNYIYDLLFYGLICGIIGARMWHAAVEFDYYGQHLIDIIKIWHGGLASHGALLAACLCVWVFAHRLRKKGKSFKVRVMLDLAAPAMALMHIFVRLGNYFNQELYGLPTGLSWGIPIDSANRIPGFESYTHFHPTFLYELVFFLIIFSVLVILHQIRIKKVKSKRLLSSQTWGSLFLIYLLSYGIERFLIEFLRIDVSNIILGLRLAQVTSLVLIIISIVGLLYLKFKRNYTKLEIDRN